MFIAELGVRESSHACSTAIHGCPVPGLFPTTTRCRTETEIAPLSPLAGR